MIKSAGTLEITTRIGCKINCRFCPQEKLLKAYCAETKELSFERFKQCIDIVPKTVRIDFSGMAEPWLNKDCTSMLLYAARKGHKIAVYTTLVGMTRQDYEAIKDIRFERFVIHLPDVLANTPITVNDEYLKFLSTVVLDSPPHLKTILQYAAHGPIHPEVSEIVGQVEPISLHDRAGNLEVDDQHIRHCLNEGKIQCALSGHDLNHNILLPNGSVILCCMDYKMEYVLGNLLTDDYSRILKNESKLDLIGLLNQASDIRGICRNCSFAIEQDKILSTAAPSPHIGVIKFNDSEKTYLNEILANVISEIDLQVNMEKLRGFDLEEIIECIMALDETDSNKAVILNLVAVGFYRINMCENVIPILESALSLEKENYYTLFNLGQISLHLGNKESALKYLSMIKQKNQAVTQLIKQLQG